MLYYFKDSLFLVFVFNLYLIVLTMQEKDESSFLHIYMCVCVSPVVPASCVDILSVFNILSHHEGYRLITILFSKFLLISHNLCSRKNAAKLFPMRTSEDPLSTEASGQAGAGAAAAPGLASLLGRVRLQRGGRHDQPFCVTL